VSTATNPSAAGTATATGGAPRPARRTSAPERRPRWAIALVGAVVVGAVAWIGVGHPFGGRSPSGGHVDNADPTATATVVRQSLSEQAQESATLGYSGSYSVVNQVQGTLTWLPALGQIVKNGQALYDVNGQPVVLLTGSTPAYRTLAEGAAPSDVEGADVQNLNYDLVALGYITGPDLGSEVDQFGSWTKVGIEDLQRALGLPVTGSLALGSVVFLPTAARITGLGPTDTLGGVAQPGSTVLTATSTSRVVTIDLDASQQGEVAVGDAVTITLPDNQTTPGTVSSVGTVATTPSGDGGSTGTGDPTVTVLVTPDDPAATGSYDQSPVNVSITTASVKDALVVPVDALLALSSGGYALEVIGAHGARSLVPVSTGLFDDADELVAVTGAGVHAGERIVVPATS